MDSQQLTCILLLLAAQDHNIHIWCTAFFFRPVVQNEMIVDWYWSMDNNYEVSCSGTDNWHGDCSTWTWTSRIQPRQRLEWLWWYSIPLLELYQYKAKLGSSPHRSLDSKTTDCDLARIDNWRLLVRCRSSQTNRRLAEYHKSAASR